MPEVGGINTGREGEGTYRCSLSTVAQVETFGGR